MPPEASDSWIMLAAHHTARLVLVYVKTINRNKLAAHVLGKKKKKYIHPLSCCSPSVRCKLQAGQMKYRLFF